MAQGNVAEAQGLATRISREQPFVQAYLLAVGKRDFNPDEAQLLFYVGVVVWQIFAEGGRKPDMVSGEAMDRAEAANEKMLSYLEDESGTGFAKVAESLVASGNQVEVLRYVVAALMEEPEEDCDIRDDSLGHMFIHLKTVIDCFDGTGEE